ncbi:MAG: NADH-quinone oxidoreductase subunit N [Nitrospinae bacterium]|nr:NADH-quinone oxidoreductase subunit N [Nitrospinota bacterium]
MIPMPAIDLGSISPMIILSLMGMFILVADLFMGRKKGFLAFIALAGLAAALVFSCGRETVHAVYSFNGAFVVDKFSLFFNLIFCVSTALVVLISLQYLDRENLHLGEYYALLLFGTVGMMMVAGAADMIMVFLGIEVLSICLYVLAGMNRRQPRSAESAMKYFLLGAFATGFLLYGIALIYGVTGSINFQKIAEALKDERLLLSPMLYIGTAFVIIGIGFKAALAPFHQWTPDVYEGAPTTVTAFMAVGPKAAAIAALFRVLWIPLAAMGEEWKALLWVLAVLTMTVGNVAALAQDNIKRMLAFSGIAHAGYILVAVITGSKMGSSSVLYYLLAYAFMNIGAFGVVALLGGKGDEYLNIDDYAGMGFKMPGIAFAMSVFMFSMAGIPPLAGFVGKFYIFSAAVDAGYIGLAIIGVINSVVSAYYYLRVTVVMYMKEPVRGFDGIALKGLPILALAISVIGIVYLGVVPAAIMELARQSAIF